jgi:putative hydrolase of the HAD superfamily
MFRDIYGAQEAGMRTVMFNSNQGAKHHEGCSPDFTISDHRDLLGLLDS